MLYGMPFYFCLMESKNLSEQSVMVQRETKKKLGDAAI